MNLFLHINIYSFPQITFQTEYRIVFFTRIYPPPSPNPPYFTCKYKILSEFAPKLCPPSPSPFAPVCEAMQWHCPLVAPRPFGPHFSDSIGFCGATM